MRKKGVNATKEYYERTAEEWTAFKSNSFHHEKPFRTFEKLLKDGDRVLDIGCAGGIHAPLFLGIGRKLQYVGIDISDKMIEIARSRYPQMDFGAYNILNFHPFERFDAIWAVAVLMHLEKEHQEKLFTHLEMITKPGGYAYITLPTERTSPESKEDQRHFTLYSKEEIMRLTDKRQWEIISFTMLPGMNKKPIWNSFIVQFPK